MKKKINSSMSPWVTFFVSFATIGVCVFVEGTIETTVIYHFSLTVLCVYNAILIVRKAIKSKEKKDRLNARR